MLLLVEEYIAIILKQLTALEIIALATRIQIELILLEAITIIIEPIVEAQILTLETTVTEATTILRLIRIEEFTVGLLQTIKITLLAVVILEIRELILEALALREVTAVRVDRVLVDLIAEVVLLDRVVRIAEVVLLALVAVDRIEEDKTWIYLQFLTKALTNEKTYYKFPCRFGNRTSLLRSDYERWVSVC